VLVCGKSGIGKSTLVRTFLAGLGDSVFVAAGRCFEREAVPFKMLDGVVDALTDTILTLPPVEIARIAPPEIGSLVRMFPVLRRIEQLADLVTNSVPAEPQELRRRGFRGLKTMLGRLATLRPVAIFVDDAHWGDADSAAFFAQLIHEPEKAVLAIFAHRPEDYLGVVATLRRAPSGGKRGEIREIVIEPLEDKHAKRVLSQLGVDQNESRAAIAIAAAEGNPLVLTEMARAPSLSATTGIDDLVRERALRLPVEAQAMLAVSAIAARPLPVEIAAHAAGVVGGLEAATRLSIERLATLHQVDGEHILHPAHDFVRTSVLGNLDVETRAGFHEAIARAFEAVQGSERLDSLAVVEHWLAAGHPANAAHHAVDAAQRAEDLFAFRRAADLYEVALSFGPWDTAGQRDLLRRKAQALAAAGQLDEAATVYGHAAQLLPDPEAIDLERLRVEALLRRGRLDEGLPAAEQLLSQIGTRIPLGRASRTRLATQWLAAKLRGLDFTERDPTLIPPADLLAIDVLYSIASGLAFADPGLGRVVQGHLTRAALDAGEPVRVCLALSQEVWYAAAGGSRNRVACDAVAQRLRTIALRVGRPEVIGFADAACGIATHMSGRWRDARASLESGLAALRDRGTGVRWEIDIAETFWLATLFYLGEWREMSRQTLSLLRDAVERADVVAQQSLRIGRCNFAWLALDRPEEAREQLEIAERSLPQDSFRLQDVSVMLAATNIDLYTRDARAAQRRIDAAWDQLDRIGCLRIQQIRVELALLRARTQLSLGGADPEHQRAAREHANAMLKEGAPWASGLGHLIRASCHAFAGNLDAARSDLTAAEEHLISTAMLGYLQIARLRRGQIEGGTLGASRVTAAREILGDLGATAVDTMIQHLVPWP
jgi:tetratricopeptide (TPR) repeat protein